MPELQVWEPPGTDSQTPSHGGLHVWRPPGESTATAPRTLQVWQAPTPSPSPQPNVAPTPKQDQPPGWERAIERGIGTAGNALNAEMQSRGIFDKVLPSRGAPEDPVQSAVRNWVGQRYRNTADATQWISQSPLGRGVDAVLGAGQRAEQSKIVEGDPLKGVFDPEGSLGVAHRGEQKIIAPALAALNQHLPGWAQGRMPNPVGPEQAGLDFAWQIGTDPQTQAAIGATLGAGIPVVGPLLAATAAVLDPIVLAKWGHEAAGGGKLLRAMSERVPEGMRTAVGKHIEKAKSGFSTSHDPLKGYTQSGLNLQRAEEGEQRFLQHHRLGEYHAAILPMEDEIHKLDAIMRERGLNSSDLATADGINRLPPAARRTLRRINAITDKALWREGTLDVRRSMKRRGFRPTAEEAKLAPTNLITKDFGKHYLPEQNIFDEAASKELKAARGWSYNRGGVKQSKFDIQKNEFAQPTDPLFERLGQRLEHSAYLEPKRRMEQTMIRKLGLHPSNAASTAERMEHLKTKLTLTPKAEQLLARLSPEQRSAAEQMLAGEVDVVADPKVMSTVGHIQKEPNLFRYQSTAGDPEFSPTRSGTYFTYGDKNSEVGSGYSDLKDGDRGPADKNIGGKNRVTRVATPKNPLDISQLPSGKQFPNHTSNMGIGVPKVLRPNKPTASNWSHIQDAAEGDLFHPDYIAEQRKNAKRYLKALGVPEEEAERISQTADGRTLSDRLGAELARKHGHDAVIHKGNLYESEALEYFALHPNAHGPVSDPKVSDPKVMSTVSQIQSAKAQRQALEKHLGKYQTLFGKQAGEVAENEQRRAKYLRPDAPQTETKLPGVLRSHEEATARAVNQSRFLGKSLEAAFNDEGERLGHVNTGRASERAQNKTVEAGRARRDEEAVRKQLRKSETSRGKETARVEKAVETGKAQLSKQAEKGVDAAIKSDQNLTAGLKGVPGLNEQRQVGYARSGGGMLGEGLTGKIDGQSAIDAEAAAKAKKLHGQRGQVTPGGPNPKGEEPVGKATALRAALARFQELEETQETRQRKPATKKAAKSPYQHVTPPAGEARHFFQPETQTLLNRKGEKLRGTIDPAYNALQRAARPTSINRPFQETASAVSRLGGHSTTKPLADIGERFSKNVAGRQKTALHAQQKQHELLKQNAAVEELNKRLEADPRYQASIPMPSAVNERLFGPKVYPEPHSLTDAGNAIRNAQFSFPFGHYFGNILDQQNLAGGGLGSVLAGALESAKIAKKDPAALRRLEQTQRKGATHIEGYESGLPELEGEDLLAKASRLPQKAQDALTIAEQGQASHLFHKYLEKGMSPEDAAEEVRKTFGRPHEHSAIVKSSTNAGAPFANWLLSTVPRSAKKVLSNPSASRSLEAYARATRDTNEDWLEPEYGVDLNPGGWVSRAAELGLALPTYMSSRSLESPLTSMGEESRIDPGEALSTVAPFVGPIRELTGQPLTENERLRGGFKELPWWMTGPSAMRGGYFRRAESQKHALLRELQRRGLL